MGKYLDPKADLTFKKVFKGHPDLLISLLNALLPLPEDRQIESIDYLPAELVPENPLRKSTIVDVRCKDISGRHFVVEMQMEWTTAFMQRVLFNASKVYVSQVAEGELYRKLQPVYSLNLVNDIFERDVPDYRHDYSIVHDKYSDKIIEGLHFTFIELPKFTPQSYSEKRMAVLWLRYLTEIDSRTTDVPSDLLDNPFIGKALNEVRKSAFSEAELATYEKFWDIVSREMTLAAGKLEEGLAKGREEGLEEGLAKGREEGLEEGLAKGREEGLAKGREEERLEIARKLKVNGVSTETIATVSGLSVEEVECL